MQKYRPDLAFYFTGMVLDKRRFVRITFATNKKSLRGKSAGFHWVLLKITFFGR
jgi:hypothetical protein